MASQTSGVTPSGRSGVREGDHQLRAVCFYGYVILDLQSGAVGFPTKFWASGIFGIGAKGYAGQGESQIGSQRVSDSYCMETEGGNRKKKQ